MMQCFYSITAVPKNCEEPQAATGMSWQTIKCSRSSGFTRSSHEPIGYPAESTTPPTHTQGCSSFCSTTSSSGGRQEFTRIFTPLLGCVAPKSKPFTHLVRPESEAGVNVLRVRRKSSACSPTRINTNQRALPASSVAVSHLWSLWKWLCNKDDSRPEVSPSYF